MTEFLFIFQKNVSKSVTDRRSLLLPQSGIFQRRQVSGTIKKAALGLLFSGVISYDAHRSSNILIIYL